MAHASSSGPSGVQESPTLSVVMPNYNHARYIQGALEAHLNQSVPPLEIIVVDDASTDDSCAVVERIAAEHPVVRLIRLDHNVGPIPAGKRALREAKGECVCFSAADDLVSRDFVQRSLEALALFPAAAFCFSDPAELIGDSGVVRRFPLYLSDHPAFFSPDDIERIMRRNYFTFSTYTAVYRRDALLSVGGFREDLDWQAEWIVNFALAFRHGACYVPAVLGYLRMRPDSYFAVRGKRTDEQRAFLYRALELLKSEAFQDVAPRFRHSALVPDMRLRVLFRLLASPRHRGYITPKLAGRLLGRELWSMARPVVPLGLRRFLRWLVALPTRKATRKRRMVSTV